MATYTFSFDSTSISANGTSIAAFKPLDLDEVEAWCNANDSKTDFTTVTPFGPYEVSSLGTHSTLGTLSSIKITQPGGIVTMAFSSGNLYGKVTGYSASDGFSVEVQDASSYVHKFTIVSYAVYDSGYNKITIPSASRTAVGNWISNTETNGISNAGDLGPIAISTSKTYLDYGNLQSIGVSGGVVTFTFANGTLTGSVTSCEDDECEVSLTAGSGATQLSPPSGCVVTAVSDTGLNITFTGDTNATSYTLEYDTQTTFGNATTLTGFTSGSTVTGLTGGTAYSFRIKSIGDGVSYSNSDWCTTFSGTTKTKLATPAIQVTTASATSVNVVLGTVSNASSVEVIYGTVNSREQATGTATYTYGGNPLTITGLTTDTTYYFWCRATTNDSGYVASDYSSGVSCRPHQVTVLDAPTISLGTVSCTSVKVSFSAVSNAGSYVAEYDESSDFSSPYRDEYFVAGDNLIIGLDRGQRYYVRVKAVSDSEDFADSAWSNVVNTTTLTTPVRQQFTVTETTSDKLGSLAVAPGQMVFCRDTRKLYIDVSFGVRVRVVNVFATDT